jgi:hypothetical protein
VETCLSYLVWTLIAKKIELWHVSAFFTVGFPGVSF